MRASGGAADERPCPRCDSVQRVRWGRCRTCGAWIGGMPPRREIVLFLIVFFFIGIAVARALHS